ncbi:MAG: hypothetical protein KBB65_08550 [Syntrophorhabdaceae bacterium]|nr:hypothetical protein [Syntrophorhabdaceae bacterium]
MKIRLFVLAAAALALCAAAAGAQGPGKALTFNGYRNIEIGMKIKDVVKVTGLAFSYDAPPEEDACTYAYTGSLPGLYIMVIDGTVARIDADKGDYTTPEGARLGDSEEKIRKLYPKVEVEGQKYVPEGHYLIVRSPDGNRAIIFDTDGKKVTAFRVGRMPEVEWVEGCN